MRFRHLFAVFSFALIAAGMTSGEDKIERIVDRKGASGKAVKELVYRSDKLAEERAYDADGALSEENFFGSTSLPIQTRKYIRVAGRLDRVEYEDADGVLTGTLSYRYDRYERLIG